MLERLINTPLGLMRAREEDGALTSLMFVEGADGETGGDSSPLLTKLETELKEYFAGERKEFDLPLAPKGTPFMKAVWERLSQIHYGQTSSYGLLAAQAGFPRAARAVGAAVGRNPITLVVPCHRVMGARGAITGYSGGEARKRALLDLEQSRKSR